MKATGSKKQSGGGGLKGAKVSDYFGDKTFNDKTMQELLPRKMYDELKETLREGRALSVEVADSVAHTMKHWAMERGATHYAHWFMPWTGATAEKHDGFLEWDGTGGAVIERFTGKNLIQGEPDASSFPSGGLRATFEARGYTVWDPTSPAFLLESSLGTTLCIPSAFLGYNGQALDHKTPLLRSMTFIDKAARAALDRLGIAARKVTAMCGPEQEYFLVETALLRERPDLAVAGRTLQGAAHVKGQTMEDHYFGSIQQRVLEYMNAFELEAYKLGIACKTRHNEVAPNQFEVAPIFEDANLAADHNQLLMEIMRKTAERMGLTCVFHEKPFAQVNGSGKHCNWSLSAETTDGAAPPLNLLDPGSGDAADKPVFLYFLAACLRGLNRHGALLRASVAVASNDHRLGANEAPPAIMSAFLGKDLERVLDQISEMTGTPTPRSTAELLDLSALAEARLAVIKRDNTDRNRTSPFAFTGNKFEFRAVGSSQPIHQPLLVINACVGEALLEMNAEVDALVAAGKDRPTAALEVIRNSIVQTRRIRFEGDNYSAEWAAEAKARGLPELKSTAEALDAWLWEDSKRLLTEKSKIFTLGELEARVSAKREHFCKTIQLEATVLIDLAVRHVVPAVLRETGAQAEAARAIASAVRPVVVVPSVSERINAQAQRIDRANELTDELKAALTASHELEGELVAQVRHCGGIVRDRMVALRAVMDEIEENTEARAWPLPSYHQLLAPHQPVSG